MGGIHGAAYDGDSVGVRELLQAGADPNERDELGYAPLHWAVFQGRCGGDRRGVLRSLLHAGADFNAVTTSGDSVLVLACRSGPPDLVGLVVEAGADVNARCGSETPLTAAAQAGCDESVRLLLSRGADRSAVGPFGLTALEWAESKGFDRVISALQADA